MLLESGEVVANTISRCTWYNVGSGPECIPTQFSVLLINYKYGWRTKIIYFWSAFWKTIKKKKTIKIRKRKLRENCLVLCHNIININRHLSNVTRIFQLANMNKIAGINGTEYRTWRSRYREVVGSWPVGACGSDPAPARGSCCRQSLSVETKHKFIYVQMYIFKMFFI